MGSIFCNLLILGYVFFWVSWSPPPPPKPVPWAPRVVFCLVVGLNRMFTGGHRLAQVAGGRIGGGGGSRRAKSLFELLPVFSQVLQLVPDLKEGSVSKSALLLKECCFWWWSKRETKRNTLFLCLFFSFFLGGPGKNTTKTYSYGNPCAIPCARFTR